MTTSKKLVYAFAVDDAAQQMRRQTVLHQPTIYTT